MPGRALNNSITLPDTCHSNLSVRGFTVTWSQTTLLAALLASGFTLLGASVDIALINTLLLFLFVTLMGLWLCDRTWRTLADPKLKILGTFWLIKIAITLIVLYAGWIPQLDTASVSVGYDPQRYFHSSWSLIGNDWNPVIDLNYQGITFYYAAIFFLFGHNPVIPALINAFVTLLGTLFLIRCAYSFAPNRTAKDWSIATLLLVSEVLWYDVMTSRETLMAMLIIWAALGSGRYFVGVGRASFTNTLLLVGTALVSILAVRTSVIIPVVLSIAVMSLILRSHRSIGSPIKVLLVVLGVSIMSIGPLIQQFIGGSDIDYLNKLERVHSYGENNASDLTWSDNSIALLITPDNALQAMAFLPLRMLLYLSAPLPNVAVSVTELINGSWVAWQRLMTIPTSIMMLLGFPYVLAGTVQAWRNRRRYPALMIIPITFWITFAAVAGGNIIIHERYRLMFTLLLFACMWFGYTRCSRREVIRWAIPWFGLLAASAFFYMGYKLT